MDATRRRILLLAVWLGTAVASGALVAWALRTGPAAPEMTDAAESERRSRPPTLAADTRGSSTYVDHASRPAGPSAQPASAGTESSSAVPRTDPEAAPASPALAWIDVTAEPGPGPLWAGGTAYAVPHERQAQQPSQQDDPWPRVELDREGRGRIPLPAAGRWDVGVVNDAAAGLTPHVEVPTSGGVAVTVRLSATAQLEVEVPDTGGRMMQIATRPADVRSGSRLMPTRDTRWQYPGGPQVWSDGPKVVRLFVPAEEPLRVTGSLANADPKKPGEYYVGDPSPVTAPGRVRLVPATGTALWPSQLSITCRIRPLAAVSTRRRLALWVDVRDTTGSDEVRELVETRVLEPEDREPEIGLSSEVSDGALEIAWRGVGIRPGRQAVPAAVAGARRREVAIDVEVDLSLCAEPLERLEVIGGRRPEERDGSYPSIWAAGAEGVIEVSTEADGRTFRTAADHISGPHVAVATDGAWWASEAVTTPQSGIARFELLPAGYLHLVPETPLDPDLGAAELVRADGAPLTMVKDWKSGSPQAFDGSVAPGIALGPLPRGEIELILRIGGVERRRIRAVVRAGRITALPIVW